jgi:hypothetical protein
MLKRRLLAAALALGAGIAFAQRPAPAGDPGWKQYRNVAMGFEASYPDTWRVRAVRGTGPESVTLSETPQAGKPQLAVQFWVQRAANPQGLPIDDWYVDQLRRMKAAPPAATDTSIAGRSALRMESVGGLGRTYQFFASLNKTDVFEITLTQPLSESQLDPTCRKVLSTVRFKQ